MPCSYIIQCLSEKTKHCESTNTRDIPIQNTFLESRHCCIFCHCYIWAQTCQVVQWVIHNGVWTRQFVGRYYDQDKDSWYYVSSSVVRMPDAHLHQGYNMQCLGWRSNGFTEGMLGIFQTEFVNGQVVKRWNRIDIPAPSYPTHPNLNMNIWYRDDYAKQRRVMYWV